MHPAPSIILFTTLSGIGFGMLAFIGLGIVAPKGTTAFTFFTMACTFAVGGLAASAFHLGHPERALKALTQWRSSWLSREVVLAGLTLALMGIYGLGLVLVDSRLAFVGISGGILALATVFATSMIYMQMRTVPRWNHWSPPVLFLGYALAGAALLTGTVSLAIWLLPLVGCIQLFAWKSQDKHEQRSESDIGTATGLGGLGKVRTFEAPHTGNSYLTDEMVFRVGRKHARVLRMISVVLSSALPAIFLLLSVHHIFAALAVLSHLMGVFIQRWLFFAEARHVVGFYYGR